MSTRKSSSLALQRDNISITPEAQRTEGYYQAHVQFFKEMRLQELRNHPEILGEYENHYHTVREEHLEQVLVRTFLCSFSLPTDKSPIETDFCKLFNAIDRYCNSVIFAESTWTIEVGDNGHEHIHIAVHPHMGYSTLSILKKMKQAFHSYVESDNQIDVKRHDKAFQYVRKEKPFVIDQTENIIMRRKYGVSQYIEVKKIQKTDFEKMKKYNRSFI